MAFRLAAISAYRGCLNFFLKKPNSLTPSSKKRTCQKRPNKMEIAGDLTNDHFVTFKEHVLPIEHNLLTLLS